MEQKHFENRELLIAIWHYCDHDWDAINAMLREKRIIDNNKIEAHLNAAEEEAAQNGMRLITILDEDYCKEFHHVYKPPVVYAEKIA